MWLRGKGLLVCEFSLKVCDSGSGWGKLCLSVLPTITAQRLPPTITTTISRQRLAEGVRHRGARRPSVVKVIHLGCRREWWLSLLPTIPPNDSRIRCPRSQAGSLPRCISRSISSLGILAIKTGAVPKLAKRQYTLFVCLLTAFMPSMRVYTECIC